MISYRAYLTLGDEIDASQAIRSVICQGKVKLAAASNAEHLAPGHKCTLLKHTMVGVIAEDEAEARNFIKLLIRNCSYATEIGDKSIGSVNFRVMKSEDSPDVTWFEEIHLINPTPEWQNRWRDLLQITNVVNAHHFVSPQCEPPPAYRNYLWNNYEQFLNYWSEWCIEEAADDVFTLESGQLENAGPIASVARAFHISAPSTDALAQQIDKLWASFPSQKQAAVWASIGAPSATSLVELVSLKKRLQATLHSEPELQVRVRDDREGFGLAIRVWGQLEVEL